ncbi:MAG: zinc-ribbon domain-containing protein [Bacteroidales bacterium]|nr:zinc-ribbon domain-containing protein [Bacteroidales bacterium]
MALIKCKECGAEISKNAKECPGCGAPLQKKHQ